MATWKNQLIADLKNISMYKTLFLYLLFLSIFFAAKPSFAKQALVKEQTPELRLDSTKIAPSKFDKEAIQEYKNQKEFKYDDAPNTELTLWDRFWMWFWDIIGRLFQGAATNPLSKSFFIFLGIGVVVFIIIKIIGSDQIFTKKSKETNFTYDLTENIHEIDYDTELARLIGAEKYRDAVRLLYLRCLKQLSDADIITWQPNKTNYNYLTEIRDTSLKNDFSVLTFQFDHIWYGDFPIDEYHFTPINQSFKKFKQQIK